MANALQAFNDSSAGTVIGATLHTLGAVGLLGGLIAYVGWHAQAARGNHVRSLYSTAAFLTYFSIVVNLVGGFMRTFAAGHPSLEEFGSSAWVRAIAIKHVFLFVGMGAAVYLLERVAPRHLRALRAGTLSNEPQGGHALGVLLVALGIVVAGVLGGLSTVLLGGASGDGDGDGDGGGPGPNGDAADAYHNATGQLVGTPLSPAAAGGDFQVDPASAALEATLTWTPAAANLRLDLESPDGSITPFPGSGGLAEGRIDAPAPGRWQFRVASPDPIVNAQWSLSIRMPQEPGNHSSHAGTVTILPGRFYEINTQSPLHGTLHWDWSATAAVAFDVHSHFDGEVQYHVQETVTAHAGRFTHDREGGYSYLWDNPGTTPVTVTYRAWGNWELDSIAS